MNGVGSIDEGGCACWYGVFIIIVINNRIIIYIYIL